MDGRGGCCIARYAGGGAYDASKINRIMQKFRPIAPRPADGSLSGSGGSNATENSVKAVRGKRKYVKRCNNNNNSSSINKKRKVGSPETETPSKSSSGGSVSDGGELVTLSLLPETPERKDTPARKSPDLLSDGGEQGHGNNNNKNIKKSPIWLSFEKQSRSDGHVMKGLSHVKDVEMPQPVKVVGSFVTVECVTDTWVDGNGIGCTDEERMLKLEGDTCPGFVTDGRNNSVWWTNKAYKEMAGQVAGEEELMVWVVMKEWVTMPVTYPAFTCKVRVTCRARSPPLTVPCDVWRMENGGYAWRLDVKAALSLGR